MENLRKALNDAISAHGPGRECLYLSCSPVLHFERQIHPVSLECRTRTCFSVGIAPDDTAAEIAAKAASGREDFVDWMIGLQKGDWKATGIRAPLKPWGEMDVEEKGNADV